MSQHIVTPKVYLIIFGTLLVFTFLTAEVARIDLGPLNIVVALLIAFFKASLVVLYFMHVRYSSRLTWVFVGAGVFWLAILLTLTMGDYFTRGGITGPGY